MGHKIYKKKIYCWFLAWDIDDKIYITPYGFPKKSDVIKDSEKFLEENWRSLKRRGAMAIKCECVPVPNNQGEPGATDHD